MQEESSGSSRTLAKLQMKDGVVTTSALIYTLLYAPLLHHQSHCPWTRSVINSRLKKESRGVA